jgi:hypothetical protein
MQDLTPVRSPHRLVPADEEDMPEMTGQVLQSVNRLAFDGFGSAVTECKT